MIIRMFWIRMLEINIDIYLVNIINHILKELIFLKLQLKLGDFSLQL